MSEEKQVDVVEIRKSEIRAEIEDSVRAEVSENVRKEEKARIREIEAIGKDSGFVAESDDFVSEGRSIDEFKEFVREHKDIKEEKKMEVAQAPVNAGLNEKEVRRFSMRKAISAMVSGKWDDAGLEREASDEIAKQLGRSAQGFYMPNEVATRDMVVGTDANGGYLVATDLLSGSFIEKLDNAMVLNQAGATIMRGLQGNVAIPKQTARSTAYWVAENGAVTESLQTLAQVALAPKTLGAMTDMSRQLILQSSIDVENFIQSDLAQSLALAIDLAGLEGTGANNQPTGILSTSGINTNDWATANTPTFAEMVGMETDVAVDNALLGSPKYITTSSIAGKLKTTAKDSGSGLFVNEGGQVNGYDMLTTNAITAGNAYFGNFADLLIGMWGNLDITVDPYTGSSAGTVRIVALQSVDVAVRNAVSFCANVNAST